MSSFTKHLVNDQETIDAIMLLTIGGSWDYIKNKYPIEYPAVLVIDGYNKKFDYIYKSMFDK